MELLAGLPKLREPKALPKWLMQTSYHQCLRWKKLRPDVSDDVQESEQQPSPEELPEQLLYQVQREQSVRDAMAALPRVAVGWWRCCSLKTHPGRMTRSPKSFNWQLVPSDLPAVDV